ncbi:hypothetical protein N657DRAFT_690525 [Parathielavia appendiculata]|uniref:Gfd2/YDR514C-like C-terminal domain-containing protein n=1 Tax=Parathielavia appendiculata TaxID=2587402 RepID=A0AAN6TZZ0_9PEZI|nr:hypothetical protein N657DRAFT_690525 [Parathielavia appendiculata]
MEDADFLARLRAITGDAAVWDGFDPTAWCSLQSEGEGSEAAAEATSAAEGQQDVGYASDDSADMILNLHKLTPAEKAANTRAGGSKLNKARQYAAGESAFSDQVAELEKIEWKETGYAMGDVADEGAIFVPFALVQNYPHMFVGKANGARAEPLFTLDALHEKRVWDLYYIHCPPDMNMKPVVLVPTYQFQHLLEVVNAKLETHLTIPPGRNEERFMMSFGIGNSPRPRFLGRSRSAQSFQNLIKAIPEPHPDDDDLSKATQLGLEGFRELLKRSHADRKRGKRSDRNRPKRIKAHQAWGRSVKRVQRYLGLRGRTAGDALGKLAALDLNMPTVDGPEGSVLFVAIDIEAWEQNQDLVTEVGIAMLDTAEIQDSPPREGGQNWFQHIRARHIRVKENSWAMNSRYVRGCADAFDFGESEFLPLSQITPLITDLIDNATTPAGAPRPVVLVFHESSSDIKYLRVLSYHVEAARNVVELVDTREMHQYMVRSNDAASLATVLSSVGIESYRHLHNAGNDAVYTLQAMVGVAVKKRGMSFQEKEKGKAKRHVPYSELKEKDGWTSNEDTDGGEPVGLTRGVHVGYWASEDVGSQDWADEGQSWDN